MDPGVAERVRLAALILLGKRLGQRHRLADCALRMLFVVLRITENRDDAFAAGRFDIRALRAK